MTHAEARELMAALFATPAGQATAADHRARVAMEAHVAECAECAREYQALRATAAALQLAMGPSAQTRQRVLDAVAQTGRPRPQLAASDAVPAARELSPPTVLPVRVGGRRLISFPRALAAAAVLALLAFVGGALSAAYLAPRPADGALAKAAMMMAEMARDPSAQAMTLQDPSGAAGGTVMYQPGSNMLVVFSEALEEPPSGRYGCYLERAGERTWVGPMQFASGTSFWAGPVRTPGLGEPGTRFVVLASPEDETPMLSGTF